MPDEHEHHTYPQGHDEYYVGLNRSWITEMTPEERQRQAARRLPKSWVIATWAILLGVTALVVLAVVSAVISAH